MEGCTWEGCCYCSRWLASCSWEALRRHNRVAGLKRRRPRVPWCLLPADTRERDLAGLIGVQRCPTLVNASSVLSRTTAIANVNTIFPACEDERAKSASTCDALCLVFLPIAVLSARILKRKRMNCGRRSARKLDAVELTDFGGRATVRASSLGRCVGRGRLFRPGTCRRERSGGSSSTHR